MAQLRHRQGELNRINAQVFVVTFGSARSARAWLTETGSPFPLLLDPGRAVYRAYGLLRSPFRVLTSVRLGWAYLRLLLAGRRWRGVRGDPYQLGGDFVIDPDGIVRFAQRSRDPTERPSVPQLLALLTRLAPQ